MKILITNTVVLNGGDASILIALQEILYDAFGADIEIIVYDSRPCLAQKYYPGFTFHLHPYYQIRQTKRLDRTFSKIPFRRLRFFACALARNFTLARFHLALWMQQRSWQTITRILLPKAEQRILKDYSEANFIISTGGTYLTENYRLEPRLLDYNIAHTLERPLVFFTQTMGPFTKPKYRRSLRQVFEKARLILLRDEASRQNIRELGINISHTHVRPDSVFALADPAALDRAGQRSVLISDHLQVAVSVRHWPHFKQVSEKEGMKRYKAAIQSVTEHLVNEYDAEITFISTCQGIPGYDYNDAEIASTIAGALPEIVRAQVRVDREFHHPLTLRDRLSAYDWVLSTRMHMAILSLIAGTPVLPVSYEFKTKELFARLGMEQWVHDIETLESEALKLSVDAFITELPSLRSLLYPEKIEHEYRRARGTAALLRDAVTPV